ncbi:MAG: putative inorganic carbon transporter subunit DabA [Chitinophagaceae bacterium]
MISTQNTLKGFIHHTSLHAFQHMKFYDAIFRASKIFGYQVTLQLADFREFTKRAG